MLLSEVAENRNAESLKDVEDVEETGHDLGEVTDDVLPTDRCGPARDNIMCHQHVELLVRACFLTEVLGERERDITGNTQFMDFCH